MVHYCDVSIVCSTQGRGDVQGQSRTLRLLFHYKRLIKQYLIANLMLALLLFVVLWHTFFGHTFLGHKHVYTKLGFSDFNLPRSEAKKLPVRLIMR